jgi:hypothetical protein
LGKQFTSVISTLDAFFTKVKGQSPLSACMVCKIFLLAAHTHTQF